MRKTKFLVTLLAIVTFLSVSLPIFAIEIISQIGGEDVSNPNSGIDLCLAGYRYDFVDGDYHAKVCAEEACDYYKLLEHSRYGCYSATCDECGGMYSEVHNYSSMIEYVGDYDSNHIHGRRCEGTMWGSCPAYIDEEECTLTDEEAWLATYPVAGRHPYYGTCTGCYSDIPLYYYEHDPDGCYSWCEAN